MLEQNRLRESGGAGGKIDGRIIRILHEDTGRHGGGISGLTVIVLCIGRTRRTDKIHQHGFLQFSGNILNPADKLRTIEQHI